FFGADKPSYSILSHTWGDDELSYQEISSGPWMEYEHKRGFQKIVAFCASSPKAGHLYLYGWVDTVCIDKTSSDKTSSAELSEAIQSMFAWYHRVAVCFVFLEDLVPSRTWSAVGGFTRGWTLQELLAPKHVVFFDTQWGEIGTKAQLNDELHRITGI
ncbi:hypothetical protein B0T26DRAFT_616096, partial [Lasiosphaeria miniovina]